MRLTSEKQKSDINKLTPFECGFLRFEERRVAYSIHFILVGIIFLVFDIELLLLFPFIPRVHVASAAGKIAIFLIFVSILRGGLFIE